MYIKGQLGPALSIITSVSCDWLGSEEEPCPKKRRKPAGARNNLIPKSLDNSSI